MEIYKANGKSFATYEDLLTYLREVNARIVFTETFVYKGTKVNTVFISYN
jgi:hypothetical protein